MNTLHYNAIQYAAIIQRTSYTATGLECCGPMMMWMIPMGAGHMILRDFERVRKIFPGRDVDQGTTVFGKQCNTMSALVHK